MYYAHCEQQLKIIMPKTIINNKVKQTRRSFVYVHSCEFSFDNYQISYNYK